MLKSRVTAFMVRNEPPSHHRVQLHNEPADCAALLIQATSDVPSNSRLLITWSFCPAERMEIDGTCYVIDISTTGCVS